VLVHRHDRLLVEAVASDLALDVPAAQDFDTAVEASRRYVAFDGLIHATAAWAAVARCPRGASGQTASAAGTRPDRVS
jgi:hypothetical protein